MFCPWAEAVARGGTVSGPHRLAKAFVKGMRRGARVGLAAVRVYDDDIDYMAESVLRHQAEEIKKAVDEAINGENNTRSDDTTLVAEEQGGTKAW